MDVVLVAVGKVVVDDQSALGNIDTSGEQVGREEDLEGPRSELLHDLVSGGHVQSPVDELDGHFVVQESLADLLASLLGVEVDEALADRGVLDEARDGLHLHLLIGAFHVVLVDTLESDVLVFDEDPHWVGHGLVGHVDYVLGHGGREEADLGLWAQLGDDLVDLLDEAHGEHLVGLVDDEHLDGVHIDHVFLEHGSDLSRGSNDHLDLGLQLDSLLQLGGSADQKGNLGSHQLGQLLGLSIDLIGELPGRAEDQDLLVLAGVIDVLEGPDQEGGCLPGAGLGLGEDVALLDDGLDAQFLDSGGFGETLPVDSSEQVRLEAERVEGVHGSHLVLSVLLLLDEERVVLLIGPGRLGLLAAVLLALSLLRHLYKIQKIINRFLVTFSLAF